MGKGTAGHDEHDKHDKAPAAKATASQRLQATLTSSVDTGARTTADDSNWYTQHTREESSIT